MKINKLVFFIFLAVFLFRLYFAFQTSYFSDDTSYLYIKQLDYVKENLKPMAYDELSYGGKQVIPSLLFPYLLLIFSFVPYGLKIFPQLIISLIVIIAYLISKQLVNDEKSAVFASLLAGFVPLVIDETLNKISAYIIAIPAIFYLIYCLTRIKERKYKILFLVLSIFISLLDPIFVFLILVLWFYLLLLYAEDIGIYKSEFYSIIIFTLLFFIINLFLLKDAINLYGIDVIYRNIPKSLLISTFKQINILTLIYHIGYIPLIYGVASVYYGTKQKSRTVFILSSLALVTTLLVALNLIGFYVGLIFVGISASMLSAIAINRFFMYINLTKLERFKKSVGFYFLITVVLLSVYPSYSISNRLINNAPNDAEINSLEWVNENSSPEDVVLGSIYEGNLINVISNRKNFFDTSFMFTDDVLERMEDAKKIFNAENYEDASILFKKYNIKFIFLSRKTRDIYGIKDLKYSESKCLQKDGIIYKIVC